MSSGPENPLPGTVGVTTSRVGPGPVSWRGTLGAVFPLGSVGPVTDPVDPVEGTVDPVEGTVDSLEGTVDPVDGTVEPVAGSVDSVDG